MRPRISNMGAGVLLTLGMALFTAAIQVALIPWANVRGATPDILVATTVALALHFGPWVGMPWGLLVGGATDILAAHPLGILALPLAAVGYMAGWGHRLVLDSKVIAPWGMGILASLAYDVLQIPLGLVWGYPVPAVGVMVQRALPRAAYTAGVAWLFFLVLLSVHRLRKRERWGI